MTGEAATRFDRLSPRMRECLHLVYQRKSSKEIALLLDLSPGTVNGYIAEAVRLLDARSRIDAAEQLHGHEQPPYESTPQLLGVVPATDAEPVRSDSDAAGRRWSLPIRTQGATGNDLGIFQRIGWIFIIALGIAVSLGGIANALRFINGLAGGR